MNQFSMIFSRTLCALMLSLVLVFVGCTEEPAPIVVTSVTLDSTSMTLVEGDTQKLTATISPSNAENKTVIWTSSNSSVASVKDGLVTAIKSGTAMITVKSDDGGKTATCEVTVNAKTYPVESISLNKTSYEMTEGDEVILTATISPENATNKNVSWSSSNTSVATVENGKVKALKAGTSTITVKTEDGNKTATCEITVNAKVYPVTGVTLDKTSYEMTEGDEVTLTATVSPENATNKNVSWSSSNTSVATVDNGKVKALKAGTATITVKTEDGNKTATCDITVNAKVYPVTGVTLDKTSYEMIEGDEVTLTATVSPENATNKNVSWSSSNTSVATVDNGKVKALKAGTATITVKTEDGNKTATCDITVNAKVYPVTGVTLDKTSYEMTEGDEVTLTATISPENATNKNVSWSSSNTSVATVENGKVKALKAGTATIIVKTEDGNKTATCDIIVKPNDSNNNSDYIDEYGINHGPGVEIDGVIWAPVNCGYHATDFKYGKLYQWGRKYGQGYYGEIFDIDGQLAGVYYDETVPEIKKGPVSEYEGQHPNNKNIFYKSYSDWLDVGNNRLWNSGTESNPKKTSYDPCPEGWRVPTVSEIKKIGGAEKGINTSNQIGFFHGNEDETQIFFPAAGNRSGTTSDAEYRGDRARYWSSSPESAKNNSRIFALIFTYAYDTNYVAEGYVNRSTALSIRCVRE